MSTLWMALISLFFTPAYGTELPGCSLLVQKPPVSLQVEGLSLSGESSEFILREPFLKRMLPKGGKPQTRENIVSTLRSSGIRYRTRIVDQKYTAYEIFSPSDSGARNALEQFVVSLRKNMGVRIQVSLAEIKESGGRAVWIPEMKRILVSAQTILDFRNNPDLFHELRHAFQSYLEKMGIESLFHGDVDTRKGLLISEKAEEPYTTYMSLDEISSYSYHGRISVSALKQALAAGEDPQLILAEMFKDAGYAKGIAEQTLQIVREMDTLLRTSPKTVGADVFKKHGMPQEALYVYFPLKTSEVMLGFPSRESAVIYRMYRETRDSTQLRNLIQDRLDLLAKLCEETIPWLKKTIKLSDPKKFTADKADSLIEAASSPRSIVLKYEKEWRSQFKPQETPEPDALQED